MMFIWAGLTMVTASVHSPNSIMAIRFFQGIAVGDAGPKLPFEGRKLGRPHQLQILLKLRIFIKLAGEVVVNHQWGRPFYRFKLL